MKLAVIGLGKMGANLARQLTTKGFEVVGYNRTESVTKALETEGIDGAYSFEELASKLSSPKIIWIMLPAGQAVDDAITQLIPHLSAGDIVIDGGNSHYVDDARRAASLAEHGIHFVDVGVSGGPAGALNGACLMVGGGQATFDVIEPIVRAVSVADGYQFFPGIGAGHFVKMVHNGIEYGMMQAIAEGFAVLKQSPLELDLTKVADIYQHGSVIESRLVGWLGEGLQQQGVDLNNVSPTVAHTGEGAWTVEAAETLGVPEPIIQESLEFRKQSATNPSYTGKLLSLMRHMFGGHALTKE